MGQLASHKGLDKYDYFIVYYFWICCGYRY